MCVHLTCPDRPWALWGEGHVGWKTVPRVGVSDPFGLFSKALYPCLVSEGIRNPLNSLPSSQMEFPETNRHIARYSERRIQIQPMWERIHGHTQMSDRLGFEYQQRKEVIVTDKTFKHIKYGFKRERQLTVKRDRLTT